MFKKANLVKCYDVLYSTNYINYDNITIWHLPLMKIRMNLG